MTQQGPQAVIVKQIAVKLNEAEKVGKLRLIAEILDDLDDHDASAAETKRSLAETRRQITDKLQAARAAASQGEETRSVSVLAEPDPSKWVIRYRDAEDPERYYDALERDMNGEERAKYGQLTIEDAASTPAKRRRSKASAEEPES